MAVTYSGNSIRFVTGDRDIRRGASRVVGVVIVGGSTATSLKLYDAEDDASGVAVFEFPVAANEQAAPETPERGIKFNTAISAALTGTGAIAYLYLG